MIFLVIFSPVFHGSLTPAPLSVIQFASFALLLSWGVRLIRVSGSEVIYPSSTFFVVLFFSILIFQLIPLPTVILKVISPSTLALYKQYLPDFTKSGFYPLTIYSFATKREFLNSIPLFFIFFVTLNIIEKRGSFNRLFLTIIFWSLALSLYGVVKRYFLPIGEEPYSFSTFGNKNHFAAYMVMAAPLAMGYALLQRERVKKYLFGFIAAIICASVFLSLSRAGALSIIFSLILMFFLLKKEGAATGRRWLISAAVLVAILVLFSGIGPIKERFLKLQMAWLWRWNIVQDSMPLIKDFPLFGVGWGNFQYIFTLYKKFISVSYYAHLHNDHLQLIAETGLIAAFFYFAFLVGLFREIFANLKTRRDPFVKNMVIGGICGLLGMVFHSFFDFNFHIPAVAFLFWFILSLIYKCSYTHFRYEKEDH